MIKFGRFEHTFEIWECPFDSPVEWGWGFEISRILTLREVIKYLKDKKIPTERKRKVLNDYPILKIYI